MTFAGGVPVRGTVRYIGEEKDSHGQVHTIVGLELVSDIGNVVVTCRIHFNLLVKALRNIGVHVYNYSPEITYMKE